MLLGSSSRLVLLALSRVGFPISNLKTLEGGGPLGLGGVAEDLDDVEVEEEAGCFRTRGFAAAFVLLPAFPFASAIVLEAKVEVRGDAEECWSERECCDEGSGFMESALLGGSGCDIFSCCDCDCDCDWDCECGCEGKLLDCEDSLTENDDGEEEEEEKAGDEDGDA